jgi:hypothetical protein
MKNAQLTCEGCSAFCLLKSIEKLKSIKFSKRLELDCLFYSLKFSKYDFVIGHLDFIVKRFDVNIIRIVDNKKFYNYVKKIKSSSKIKTEVKKINLKLINKFLNKHPILYIDSYYLFKVCHYPHFITILEKIGNKYKIFDPWEGKEKLIKSKVLAKSISSLRNHIKFCPQMIILEVKKN